MIPMECPGCGRRGNVPPDRLNTRMHCKNCDAIFFMDRSGKIILGDPDILLKKKKDQEQKKYGSKPGDKKKPRKKGEKPPSIGEILIKLPLAVKVLAGVLVLSVALFAVGFRLPKLWTTVPNKLEDLAAFVGNAWVDDKVSTLQKVAVTGGADAVKSWYDELRPKFEFKGPQVPKLGQVVDMVLNGLIEEEGGTLAVLNLYDTPPQKPAEVKEQKALLDSGKRDQLKDLREAGYKYGGEYTLPLFFVLEGTTWKLDAAKSIEKGKPKPKEEPAKKKKR